MVRGGTEAAAVNSRRRHLGPLLPRVDGRTLGDMAQNDAFRRYLDAGISLTQITRARAEELVRDLVQTGEVESGKAQDWVDDTLRRSRVATEELMTFIRDEVGRQLHELGFTDMEDFSRHIAALLEDLPRTAREAADTGARRARDVGESTVKRASATATKAAHSARSRARRAGGSTATKKATGTKKTATKKATGTKKSATKKAPAKKATGTKKSAAKKATGTNKSAAKKAPTKKATGTKKSAAKKAATPTGPVAAGSEGPS
jgi:polyhydroxyalkanoate synthesis regulator phasin